MIRLGPGVVVGRKLSRCTNKCRLTLRERAILADRGRQFRRLLSGRKHTVMKLVIYPAVEPERLQALQLAAPGGDRQCRDAATAEAAMPGAEAFFGKITPAMLAEADRLRWVQSFTASLEHYMFPELQAHPCVLTNLRGLFGDVIADQVMGYVLCFARNLHTYIRRQVEHRYEPIGGESARVSNQTGPGTVNDMDRATIYLPQSTLGIVGMGGIGCEIARRAMAFGMSVRGVDRFPDRVRPPEGVQSVQGDRSSGRALALERFRRDRGPAHA